MEKVLDLKVAEIQDLGSIELKNVNGGALWFAIAAKYVGGILLAGLTAELLTQGGEKCWDDFVEGFNSTQK